MSFDIKPGRGSERVKAWVYVILNPIIDSLRREADLLKSGNLSWRVHSRRLEYIRPISGLIEWDQQPNLEDFFAEHPTFVNPFSQHDSALREVEQAATEYVQRLLGTHSFLEQVNKCVADYEARLPLNPAYPDLLNRQENVPAEVAEFLANNFISLPRHYAMYSFWKEYGETFRDEDFGGSTKSAHNTLKAKTQELLGASCRLSVDLEALRRTLVREYDIPAAPIEPPRANLPENTSPRPKW